MSVKSLFSVCVHQSTHLPLEEMGIGESKSLFLYSEAFFLKSSRDCLGFYIPKQSIRIN